MGGYLEMCRPYILSHEYIDHGPFTQRSDNGHLLHRGKAGMYAAGSNVKRGFLSRTSLIPRQSYGASRLRDTHHQRRRKLPAARFPASLPNPCLPKILGGGCSRASLSPQCHHSPVSSFKGTFIDCSHADDGAILKKKGKLPSHVGEQRD